MAEAVHYPIETRTGERPALVVLKQYWLVVMKHWKLIVLLTVAAVVLNGIRLYFQKSIYYSEASIQVRPERLHIGNETYKADFEMTAQSFINTEMHVAHGREVAADVFQKLGPEKSRQLLGYSARAHKPDDLVMDKMLNKITTDQPEDTFILKVGAEGFTPEGAALLANTWAQSLIDYNRQNEIQSSRNTAEALAKQADKLKKSIAEKETQLASMAESAQVTVLGENVPVAAKQVGSLNDQMIAVQSELTQKQAALSQIKMTPPEALTAVQSSTAIQGLKTTCNQTAQEYAQSSRIYKPEYPTLQALKSKMDDACGMYRSEVNSLYGKAVQQARADVSATESKMASIRAQFDSTKPEVKQMNQKAAEYQTLKSNLENERKLYDEVMQQIQTTDLTTQGGGLEMSSIMSVVDVATPPRASVRPKRIQSMAMSLFLGLFCGVAFAFMMGFLDSKVHSHEDIEKVTSLRFLTFIPDNERENDERINRNAFQFLTKYVAAPQPDKRQPKVVVVTSAEPGEGKSFVASNLAVAEAMKGRKTLLVDTDIHRPTIHRVFKVPRRPGLAELLMHPDGVDFRKFPQMYKYLTVVPAGKGYDQQLTSLLERPRFVDILTAAIAEYDFIVLDTGPLLVTPETLSVASHVDGVILVVRNNYTPLRVLKMSEEILKSLNIPVLGVVLNRVSLTDVSSYYHYNNPYRYHYTYYGEQEQRTTTPDTTTTG